MTDVHTTDSAGHPRHTLISWPAVIAGSIVAIAVGAMLNLLGVALGAASLNPYDLDGDDAEGFTAAAGMWMAVANAAALFVGGAVASRAAKYADHHRGGLHGLTVWALAFLLAIMIAGASVTGGVTALLGGEAERVNPSETFMGDMMTPDMMRSDQALIVPPNARVEAEAAADTTATLALWAFLTMLLGAVAAILGGAYGAKGHRWLNRLGQDHDRHRDRDRDRGHDHHRDGDRDRDRDPRTPDRPHAERGAPF